MWAFGPRVYCARRQTPPESHFYVWGRRPLKGPQPGVLWEGPEELRGGRPSAPDSGGWVWRSSSHIPATVVQVSLCVSSVHGFNILSSRSEIEGDRGFSVSVIVPPLSLGKWIVWAGCSACVVCSGHSVHIGTCPATEGLGPLQPSACCMTHAPGTIFLFISLFTKHISFHMLVCVLLYLIN